MNGIWRLFLDDISTMYLITQVVYVFLSLMLLLYINFVVKYCRGFVVFEIIRRLFHKFLEIFNPSSLLPVKFDILNEIYWNRILWWCDFELPVQTGV